jgi:hypothetical protein
MGRVFDHIGKILARHQLQKKAEQAPQNIQAAEPETTKSTKKNHQKNVKKTSHGELRNKKSIQKFQKSNKKHE